MHIKTLLFLGIFLTTLEVHAACPLPTADQVVVYTDSNHAGSCRVLGPGSYSSASAFGVSNDAISSIRVGANVRAVLYEHTSFTGREALYEAGSFASLGINANDETSSILVQATGGKRVAFRYLGNYPNDRETFWTPEANGIAHDASHWFIARNAPPTLYRFRLVDDLNVTAAVQQVGMPSALASRGCNHFGDPDQYGGYLFMPVECPNGLTVVAVFDAANLAFRASQDLPSQDRLAWIALHPVTGTLYTSNGDVNGQSPVRTYAVDYSRLASYQGGFLTATPWQDLWLTRRNGTAVDLRVMQGGVFSSDGQILYLTNGSADCVGGDGNGLRAFDLSTCRAIGNATQEYGLFRYEQSCGWSAYEEPEGLDYFDLAGRGTPGMSGKLHVLLLDNDSHDDVYLKHYNTF